MWNREVVGLNPTGSSKSPSKNGGHFLPGHLWLNQCAIVGLIAAECGVVGKYKFTLFNTVNTEEFLPLGR